MSDSQLQAPTNGAEQRLDLILGELRGLRAALHQAAPQSSTPTDQVELREAREPKVLGRRR